MLKTASDFKGSVVGETEQLTKAIIEMAQGKVLVIDEAYICGRAAAAAVAAAGAALAAASAAAEAARTGRWRWTRSWRRCRRAATSP